MTLLAKHCTSTLVGDRIGSLHTLSNPPTLLFEIILSHPLFKQIVAVKLQLLLFSLYHGAKDS